MHGVQECTVSLKLLDVIIKRSTMVPINPWAWYQVNDPDKIPDLNPHDDDEARGCISSMISFGLAVLIFVLIQWGLLELRLSKTISRDMYFWLILANILLFAGLTILFMNIGFKIVDKINKRKKDEQAEKTQDSH